MNVAHFPHHVTLLQKILVTRESSWGWKARKSIRSWQNPKKYRSCFLEMITVFILVLLSSLSFSEVHAGSTVYKSFLGTIPCPPCVHDYKITIIFPVEIPWHVFFTACQSYSLITVGMSWLNLQLTPPSLSGYEGFNAASSNQHLVHYDLNHRIQKDRLLFSAMKQVRHLAASKSWTIALRILFSVDSLISFLTHMQKCL